MSEVRRIAGVEAWPFSEMDVGNLTWEAHKRLRAGERIVDRRRLVLMFGDMCAFRRFSDEDGWRQLVKLLRSRDEAAEEGDSSE